MLYVFKDDREDEAVLQQGDALQHSGLQVQGRDYVFKSILYSHVVLYWMLVAAACRTAHDADLHPLTALGQS